MKFKDKQEEDCNYNNREDETSMTGGGEAYSEPLDKEYIRREKIQELKEKVGLIIKKF